MIKLFMDNLDFSVNNLIIILSLAHYTDKNYIISLRRLEYYSIRLSTAYKTTVSKIKASCQVPVELDAYCFRTKTHYHSDAKTQRFGGVAGHFVDATLFVVAVVVVGLSIAHGDFRNLKLLLQAPRYVILEPYSHSLILTPCFRGLQFYPDYTTLIQGLIRSTIKIRDASLFFMGWYP